ncbi:MAG: hypothetical protein HFF50_10205 [Lawsonibacter sp.]|nr:hypothetical protein [Lawsonibacter sp.]
MAQVYKMDAVRQKKRKTRYNVPPRLPVQTGNVAYRPEREENVYVLEVHDILGQRMKEMQTAARILLCRRNTTFSESPKLYKDLELLGDTYFDTQFFGNTKSSTLTFRTTESAEQSLYTDSMVDTSPVVRPACAGAGSAVIEVRGLIPIPYLLFGSVFLGLSLLFGGTFYRGSHGGKYLIGPWTNLLLLVASLGLLATAVAAWVEWRKLQHGRDRSSDRPRQPEK